MPPNAELPSNLCSLEYAVIDRRNNRQLKTPEDDFIDKLRSFTCSLEIRKKTSIFRSEIKRNIFDKISNCCHVKIHKNFKFLFFAVQILHHCNLFRILQPFNELLYVLELIITHCNIKLYSLKKSRRKYPLSAMF